MKKKTKKLDRINCYISTYTNLDSVCEGMREYLYDTDIIENNYDEKVKMYAQFMYDLGVDGDFSLESEYLKLLANCAKKDGDEKLYKAIQNVIDIIENLE